MAAIKVAGLLSLALISIFYLIAPEGIAWVTNKFAECLAQPVVCSSSSSSSSAARLHPPSGSISRALHGSAAQSTVLELDGVSRPSARALATGDGPLYIENPPPNPVGDPWAAIAQQDPWAGASQQPSLPAYNPATESHYQGHGLVGEDTAAAHAHKALYPLNAWDWAGITLSSVGLMIAAAGGIGGGGILVPIYILVLQFLPKYAIPLSNITIFGGAITNTLLNFSKRHPLADRPLVDWDLILVMEPLTIGGALVGSFINKVLPDWVLTIALVLLLTATAKRTMEKGIKTYRKETKQLAGEAARSSELTTLHETQMEELDNDEEESLLTDEDRRDMSGANEHAFELKQILEEERETPLFLVGIITGVFIVVLAVNILKGGGAFDSPLGIECGSFAFWTATGFIFVWVLGVSAWARRYLINRYYLKEKVGYKYVEGDVLWDERATIKYPAFCFFAGFFAGMFGVGGGIVKGPLMLEMGVHPLVASATSACMILYTSFTATTSFLVFGLVKMDYAVMLFSVGLVTTFFGQVFVNYLVKKYKRSSFIILSIGSVVALSALLMGGQSIYSLAFPNDDVERGGICTAGE